MKRWVILVLKLIIIIGISILLLSPLKYGETNDGPQDGPSDIILSLFSK